jgi:hypothetical protein
LILSRKKDRRKEADSEAEEAHWENIRLRLAEILATSVGNSSLVSAGLRAMLDVLAENGLNKRDAKAFIAIRLNAFRE